MDAANLHIPVMLEECLNLLRPALNRSSPTIYVDCTLGIAGHALAVLKEFENTQLIGIDRDAKALDLANKRLTKAGFADRITLVHATYDQIPTALQAANVKAADAILMDLGVSSFQIDTPERGFSYSKDAPLDMRMDTDSNSATAAEILNSASEARLIEIFSTYGEERYSKSIARNIVKARQNQPFNNSARLVELIEQSIPAKARYAGSHPAKRVFQALRIAVNEELEILQSALSAALESLNLNGRLVVESYHSLEDRIVKRAFVKASSSSAPAGLPIELAQFKAEFELLTRSGLKASENEQLNNPRSKSVRLRAIQRIEIQNLTTT